MVEPVKIGHLFAADRSCVGISALAMAPDFGPCGDLTREPNQGESDNFLMLAFRYCRQIARVVPRNSPPVWLALSTSHVPSRITYIVCIVCGVGASLLFLDTHDTPLWIRQMPAVASGIVIRDLATVAKWAKDALSVVRTTTMGLVTAVTA